MLRDKIVKILPKFRISVTQQFENVITNTILVSDHSSPIVKFIKTVLEKDLQND